ncbi:Terpene cyclase/mutase family member [Rhynchospora pubera]|uniref:Terpene cyclase/mutase family member n=1 Tax=Rhynchospora pubera TaxID=906938 RepID=A0AAV8HI43_9POAL|nr:Terpene cyclase/mutase family member [Rhynchospora pubera]
MWKLKIAEGGPLVKTCNGYVGRETWEFDERLGSSEDRDAVEKARKEFHLNRHQKKQSSDLLARMQLAKENNFDYFKKPSKNGDNTEKSASVALQKALDYFSAIQAKDGHWPGDLPGPLFLTPIMVIVLYVTESFHVLSSAHRTELRRYMYNLQNEDGGWGLQAEMPSCMICTALNYTALRLLGEEDYKGDDEAMHEARKWIHDHGGVTMIASWGKLILSVLGVYEWSGVNPMPPELFLLPSFFPIHPGKFFCRIRLILVAMLYLYGKRFVGPITNVVLSLREELHIHPYHRIDWNQARDLCAKEDRFVPHSKFMDYLNEYLYKIGEPLFATWPMSLLRQKALNAIEKYLQYEDEITRYICMGAFEKFLRTLCCSVRAPNSKNLEEHLARVPDFLWIGEDGMKMRASSSQSWDAALAVQAILACDLAKEKMYTLRKAHDFIKASQLLENPTGDFGRYYRHFSKGGWAFATADEGWPVSDCTAEALKALLLLARISPELVGEHASSGSMYEAVNFILSLQNPNGGFSTWELQRTYPWVEALNVTDMFADTMVEYQYVECTSSAIQALLLFNEKYPLYRSDDIQKCIKKATSYVLKSQNDDGSWFGSWGVCYTYGTWFGVEALIAAGKTYKTCEAIRRACAFLLSKQLPDGGWGESYLSSIKQEYTNLVGNKSNLVNTAWAMLTLLKAGQVERDPTPLHRAASLLIHMQSDNGDFPQQEMTGSFMKSGFLNYMAYRNIFPIWALGEYNKISGISHTM